MATPNDDIVITGSRNLDDDTNNIDKNAPQESERASIRTMEEQGIFIENEDKQPQRAKPREEFSRELHDMSGIEIIPNGDTEV